MSNETRRASNQEGPCPIVIPVRALNARGEEVILWPINTDDVYVFDSLDSDSNVNGGVGVGVGVGVHPATQDSIQNLERFRINEGVAPGDDSMALCSICLGVLSLGSEAIRMPHPCSHVYHHHCIIKWLNMSNTCPLCRRTI